MADQVMDSLSIAIVGMSVRFPGADDTETLWRNLREGVESIRVFAPEELEASAWTGGAADPELVPAAGTLDGVELFDAPFFGFTPREAALTDPQHRILLECAWEALERAGVDPERFAGEVGVFAGSGLNTYFLRNVLPNPRALANTARLQVMVGADKDYLAPLVSYKLDLRGPSVSVQTACSTSLVAVHMACQSLQDYQCDLALAGGVSIQVPQKSGHRYQEGGIYSPDGHCRPFDARAAGTVGGSGAGMVLLKRYEEALADGDPIHAVIRGTAINNDGAAKVGFTAPSVAGQAAVVSEALSAAGVRPEEVGYVEAHGTATPLGDPIEVAALHQVFGAGRGPGTCGLGSIKSNLGHLDAAAGVAGLIKTALALEHRTLPPSLHFETPNPEIDFAAGPFRVPRQATPWDSNGAPRRAGVSSFGIGGTNAHAVLEEAPQPEAGGPSRPWQLLLLSARTEAALTAATSNLAVHLRERPDLGPEELADLAHTLQTGRRVFAHRRALVCRDRDDALRLLSGQEPERVATLVRSGRGRPVVFLFPGQGAQYPGMSRGLYASEAPFREAVDRCAEILRPHLGLDLREVLYPEPGSDAEAAERLRATALAQPALFTVGYALARLFAGWGVAPAAMLGHSIGEWAAAAVAGVFTLEDALALVALRGRLMDELPGGAMLSVPLAEAEVSALLEEAAAGGPEDGGGAPEVVVAAVNGPAFTTVSGTAPGIARVEARLAERGVSARRLHTSHAFHSPAMDAVVDRFAAAVGERSLEPPARPFVSNLSGTWIEDGEATDPAYWARHLRRPVRFADGLATLLADPARVFLELGPGRTLTTLARRHPARRPEHDLVATLPGPRDGGAGGERDLPVLLEGLGRLWLAGAAVDWAGFAGEERRRRVELPTYPFERRRHWIEAPRQAAKPAAGSLPAEAPEAAAPVAPTAPAGDRPELTTAFVAPRDELEARIARIWGEALGIGRIGAHDDFFELGGHSLLAAEIGSVLRRELGLDVALADLFERPTVAGMAERARTADRAAGGAGPEALPSLEPDPARWHEPFPLTDVQQAYWIGRAGGYELGGVATHIYREIDTTGVDLDRLGRALDRVIERQAMLRAVVLPDGRQRVLPRVPPYRIGVLDLRGAPREGAEAALADVRRAMSHQVLPADRWPLFEVRASLRDGGRTRFHVSFDFLIGDAWSFQVLSRELALFYDAPDASPPPLEISFRDYVLACRDLERSPAYEQALAFWRSRLEDLPPAPELPLAKSPSELRAPRFRRLGARLPAAAWGRLKEGARGAGLTPSGVLLAAFSEVLARWSKSPRFTLNLTLFNRLPLHRQVGDLVGDFTSLTLLAVEHDGARPFVERARALQDRLWRDLDHRLVSGVRVMRELARLRGRAAATMPVVFTSTLNMTAPGDGRDETAAPGSAGPAGEADGEGGYSISQTPQVWIDHQVTETNGVLEYNWDVVEELFPAGLLEDLFGAYRALLERLAGDPDLWRARDLELVPAAQIEVRRRLNATPGLLPSGLLQDPFLARAAEAPDRPAVITPAGTVTYGHLRRSAAGVARRLRELGSRPGELVAVILEKGWEQLAAALGVVEAGAAYLPVDPALPAERRRDLLEDGGVALAVTRRSLARELEWPAGVRPVAVEEAVAAGPGSGSTAGPATGGPGDLAYVIYTSGSTGRPKGVMIDHRSAGNTVADVNRRFAVGPDDRVFGISSLSFDLSVYDLFGLLGAGGAVVLPDPASLREPADWEALARAGRVTLWNSVPALMEMLVEHAEAAGSGLPPGLRAVLLSGDWIPLALPERIRRLAAGPGGAPEIVSLGGATEGAIWSILHPVGRVEPGWRSIPYGRPMAGQSFHVLGPDLGARPDWVPGELAIGGAGVALGYWRRGAKTAERFVPDPETGERLYRTGDLGRYLPGGTIEFLGREDFQVKIRGYRVELGEIEAALTRHPAVAEAVVAARSEGSGPGRERGRGKRLVAYVVPRGGAALEPEALREHLAARLPEYMVPSAFVELAAFPLTGNGKVDRKALPEPEAGPEAVDDEGRRAPRTEVERELAGIVGELLGREAPAVDRDLFDLGADSLTAARLVARVRSAFGVELPLQAYFDDPTVAGLARRIEAGGRAAAEAIPRRPEGEPAPLSLGQERLWRYSRAAAGRPVYHLVHAWRLPAGTSPGAAARALGEILRRHETLRTRFREDGAAAGGPPVAEPLPPGPPRLPVVDLAGLPEGARERVFRRAAGDLARPAFRLDRGPLLRPVLARSIGAEDAGGSALVLAVHHAVVDGWSLGVMERELEALLQAAPSEGPAGRPSPLPEPPVSYGDFAHHQRRRLAAGELDDALGYWRRCLDGAPSRWCWPGREEVGREPARRSFRGGTAVARLDAELTAGLHALARRAGATPFTLLLAAFATALGAFTGRDDLVIATPVDLRRRRELEALVGYFVNLLPVRLRLAGTFEETLARAREAVVGALVHGEAPFEAVAREVTGSGEVPAPFTGVVFTMPQAAGEAGRAAGAEPGPDGEAPPGGVRRLFTRETALDADLTLYALVVPGREEIVLRLGFDGDLFEPAAAEGILAEVVGTVRAVVGGAPGALSAARAGEVRP